MAALRSPDHSEHPRMPYRRKNNNRLGLKKLWFEEVKRVKSKLFDRLDPLNQTWPFIFIWWGGLPPNRVETLANPVSKYKFYMDFMDLNWSDRPCEPVWLVCPGCRTSIRHIFLIQCPYRTFHICISIISTRSTQRWSPFCILSNLTKPVWPVLRTDLIGPPSHITKIIITSQC